MWNEGDEVYLASTFACSLDFPIKEMELTPVAFSSMKKASQRPGTAPARTVELRTAIRQWFGPGDHPQCGAPAAGLHPAGQA